MNINIREEHVSDYRLVEEITRRAFSNKDYECDEHYIVHKLRNSDDCVKELSYVLELDDVVVGHIIYSKCSVVGKESHTVITFGPVSIEPKLQGKGLGSTLIDFTLKKAKELGYKGVVIFGHPNYYPRFGFKNAKQYGISTNEGENGDYFMALELFPGSLKDVEGRFYQSSLFEVDQEELETYNELL